MTFINRLYSNFRRLFSGHYPKLYRICNRRKSIVKFVFAGGAAGLTNLAFLYLFHGVFGWDVIFSTSAAFILSFAVSFSLQKLWTFRNYRKGGTAWQLAIYLVNAFIGLGANGYLMFLFVKRWEVWYILAQIFVGLILAVWNFLFYKFIVFRTCKHEIICQ